MKFILKTTHKKGNYPITNNDLLKVRDLLNNQEVPKENRIIRWNRPEGTIEAKTDKNGKLSSIKYI